ncbi:pantoate--beta-alanine ligase [Alkalihalobacillus pseudalcaliphilus]|uniref:pantoate--beta-alanine ligase n=1 Tax=Alkalihalobacillus pseudalcaliphilus TaxID=79884 RepID=UPI00064DD6C5|nr:pantoate--beta-alanine ligase [Alkalihalobacillus pseudalcaliphilus]KMK76411.1 pantoate--beta-alanine ligase [Alkalihalobacillus pseudalcaliphilus]
MNIYQLKNDIRIQIRKHKEEGKTIGFVATMGYLHEGHLTLVQEAKRQCDLVVMSIFVNPLQFGPSEDFDRYPRDIKRDRQLAEEAGVDYLFLPTVDEMYKEKPTMAIHITQGTDVLCGASRPGHFNGVAMVVMKLFQIIQPDKAFFGLKDAQQVAVIENMVTTFEVPVEVMGVDTVREKDGLAKSSRNVYLTKQERVLAPKLYEALSAVKKKVEQEPESYSRDEIVKVVKNKLEELPLGDIDYVEALPYPSLEINEQLSGKILIALAYKFAKARLIDNVIVSMERRENEHVTHNDESKTS